MSPKFDQDMGELLKGSDGTVVGEDAVNIPDPDLTESAKDERHDNEDLRQQLAQFRDFRVGNFIEGLGLQWRNANSIRIKAGKFGAGDEMFELKANTELPISNAGNEQFVYIFLGIKDDNRDKIKPFFSKDFNGGNDIKGFTRTRRIGTVLVDSSGDVEEFVQCGEFNTRRYTLRESFLVLDGVAATFTLVPGDNLPAGLCSFYFQALYEKSGAVADLLIYATPELSSDSGAPALADTKLVGGGSGKKMISTFHMNRDGELGIWVAYTPLPDVIDELRLREWEEDV
jgi:hypothetical protein